jgi:hypothetical protein
MASSYSLSAGQDLIHLKCMININPELDLCYSQDPDDPKIDNNLLYSVVLSLTEPPLLILPTTMKYILWCPKL